MNKRVIWIDWDDTIGDWEGEARAAQQEIYDKYEIAKTGVGFEDWYKNYHEHNAELWKRYAKGEVDRPFLMRDRFLYPIEKAGFDTAPRKKEEVADEMSARFLAHSKTHFAFIEGAEEVVKALAEKYVVTIVSNGFAEVQHKKLAASGLADRLSGVILSEEVGVKKPNREILDIAFARNKAEIEDLKREEVVMVGDSWSSDIEGAWNAGVDAIWIPLPSVGEEEVKACVAEWEKRKAAAGEGAASLYVIKSIKELLNCLES